MVKCIFDKNNISVQVAEELKKEGWLLNGGTLYILSDR